MYIYCSYVYDRSWDRFESADIDLLIARSRVMESNKSKGNRRGNNRRRNGGNKENKMREIERIKISRSEESILWNYPVSSDNESKTDIAEQEMSVDLENFDNGELLKCFILSFFFLLLSRRTQLRLDRYKLEISDVTRTKNIPRLLFHASFFWDGTCAARNERKRESVCVHVYVCIISRQWFAMDTQCLLSMCIMYVNKSVTVCSLKWINSYPFKINIEILKILYRDIKDYIEIFKILYRDIKREKEKKKCFILNYIF